MVSTRGQINRPLVDIGAVQREYWERKTIELPSLAKFQKEEKSWKKPSTWFQKTHTPVCVIRRLTDEEWRQIDEKFYHLKLELGKNQNLLNKLTTKMMQGKKLTKKQQTVMNHHMSLAMPIYYGMLEVMIEEPDLDYEGVKALLDCCDQKDRDSLLAYVNVLTSEKMSVMQAVYNEKSAEINQMTREVEAQFG